MIKNKIFKSLAFFEGQTFFNLKNFFCFFYRGFLDLRYILNAEHRKNEEMRAKLWIRVYLYSILQIMAGLPFM